VVFSVIFSGELTVDIDTLTGDGSVTFTGEDPEAMPTLTGDPDNTTVGELVTKAFTPRTDATGAIP
jgi:hypothetical protein